MGWIAPGKAKLGHRQGQEWQEEGSLGGPLNLGQGSTVSTGHLCDSGQVSHLTSVDLNFQEQQDINSTHLIAMLGGLNLTMHLPLLL